MRNLQRGLPWLRKLGTRSSVAMQAQMFYEELLRKMSRDQTDLAESGNAAEQFDGEQFEQIVDENDTVDWGPDIDFTDPLFQAQIMVQDANAWAWDSYHDQTLFQ